MTIDSLKQLEALLKLCRKSGVAAIEVDGIKLALGNEPIKPVKRVPERLDDPLANVSVPVPNIYDPIEYAKAVAAKATQALKDKIDMPDELTEEQLINYSVRDNTFEGQQ